MARPGDSGCGLLGVGGKFFGWGRVDLDEDALSRAHLGGVNDGLDVPFRYPGEAAGAAGIVARPPCLSHVGDAIFELDEHVVAMVDADSVTRTQVLVDPHSHDSE